MDPDLTKRAIALDNLRSRGIADRLTLGEARRIVSVWGKHLEYSGGLRSLFMGNIPESLLPYPIGIIQGALNKMESYYYSRGQQNKVKLLEETEVLLVQYTDDKEALNKIISRLSNKKWLRLHVKILRDMQKKQAENGYLVNKELWGLSNSRIMELEKEKKNHR